MTTTTTGPLEFDDAVAWAHARTGHLTDGPSRDHLLRLASGQYHSVQWISQDGHDITVTYSRDSETYTCEETVRGEPAGTTLLRELRHSHGIDGPLWQPGDGVMS